jgi:hypothetical protein
MLLLFVIGFIIRSIPNLLTAYPIGYDTIDYATQIYDWSNILQDPNIIFKTPLFVLLADVIFIVSNSDPFVILRFLQPLLYGFLVASFYYACKTLYSWDSKWIFFSAFLFSLQTVTLRISWDLFKNELGLALLLLTLPRLKKPQTFSFILLTILIVLSHQIVSFILLGIIFVFLLRYYLRKKYSKTRNLLLASVPFAILFVLVFFFRINVINLNVQNGDRSVFSPSIISYPLNQSLPFPFVNYIEGEGLANYQGSYFTLLIDIFSLYAASFMFILFFLIYELLIVQKAVFSNRSNPINVWMIFCTLPILNCIFFPVFALFSWHRWMLMLIVPYSIYATAGIIKLSSNIRLVQIRKYFHICIVIVLGITCLFYLAMPYSNSLSLYSAFNPSSKYAPTTMMRNSVPLDDIQQIGFAFPWADLYLAQKSCLLIKDAFLDWAKIFSSSDLTLINYKNQDVLTGVNYARDLNFTDIYWLWWDNGVGLQWYGETVPDFFVPVYQLDTINIYMYIP